MSEQEADPRPVVLVSACLLGRRCRHDGGDAYRAEVTQATAGCRVVAVCPEELGGLPTPREPASFTSDALGAPLRTASGRDVTAAFFAGAERALEIAGREGATRAVLKGKSPSCGVTRVYVGDALVPGIGVTARALREAGLELEELD